MFDFPMTEFNIWAAFYCIVFYFVILVPNYKCAIKSPFESSLSIKKQRYTIVLIGVFIVSHCMKGDFFHMMESVHNYEFIPGAYNYGETVYVEIGKLVNRNYLLFRIIVWGGAYVAFCYTAKRMSLPVYYAAMIFFATHVATFSYARVSASMALYFLGLSYYSNPLASKIKSYILGGIYISLSLFFHNSAIIMVAMTFVLFVPIRKWSIVLMFAIIPLFAYYFKAFFDNFAFGMIEDDVIAGKLLRYSDRSLYRGIASQILSTLKYAAIWIPFLISVLYIFKGNNFYRVPVGVVRYMKVTFAIVYVATTFLFFGDSYVTFYYRILFMSMIPIVIMTLSLYKHSFISKHIFFWCNIFGILWHIARYMYDIYLANMGIYD